MFLTEAVACEQHTLEPRKSMRKRKLLPTDYIPILYDPCEAWGKGGKGRGVWTEDIKFSLRKRQENCWFNVGIFVYHYQKIFILIINTLIFTESNLFCLWE